MSTSRLIPAAPAGAIPAPWQTALTEAGFTPNGRAFRLPPHLGFHVESRWAVWTSATAPARASGAAVPSTLFLTDTPGLWLPVGPARRPEWRLEIPLDAIASAGGEEEEEDTEPASFRGLQAWVLAAWAGKVPEGWQAPARAEVESWLPDEALTFRWGAVQRQITLDVEDGQWRLRLPVLNDVPVDLCPPRVQALDQLVIETRNAWRMVRVGYVPTPSGRSLVIEVDLRGAPASAALLLAGLDGLKHAATWLAETAELLADRSEELHLLPL